MIKTLYAQSPKWLHVAQNLGLIALSLVFLPLDTTVLIWSLVLRHVFAKDTLFQQKQASQRSHSKPRTILVTGVGMTKGLALARSFHLAGHTVIGADFEPNGTLVCGRVSKSLSRFVPLSKPTARDGSAPYIQSLLDVVTRHSVDLWVSCSGVASAVEDGEAKEIIERRTSCKAIQFDVAMTQTLHEKHTFIAYTQEIGLSIPETHTIISRAAVDSALRDAPDGRKYIMKTIGVEDAFRADMTLLPKDTPAATSAHLDKLRISEKSPWILQQFIPGREFCTHALVICGHVKAFVACPSAELLMHYEALPPDSRLSQEMLKFTRTYANNGGSAFTGHLSFDFLIEHEQLGRLDKDKDAEITLYPIECNPRAHTAVALFNGTPEMADAYLSLLDDNDSPSSYAEATADGTSHEYIVTPRFPEKQYYWIGHDFINLICLPLLNLVTLDRDARLTDLIKGADLLLDRLLFWKDGTYELWDPLPWWWLYHVYWPWQFVLCLWMGRRWSRVNVSTMKMFEC